MTKAKNRVLILILALALMVGILALPASAASVGKTKFKVTVWVKDKYEAGTNSTVKFVVNFINGKKESFKMDKSWHDDFRRGKSDTYSFTIDYPLYFVKSYAIYNTGSDALCIKKVRVIAYDKDNNELNTTEAEPNGKWIEKSSYTLTPNLQRKINNPNSYKEFTKQFSNTVYLDESDRSKTGAVSISWTPKLESDGWYGSYDPYNYPNPPELTYQVFVASDVGGGWAKADAGFQNLFEQTAKTYNDKSYQTGFTYTPADMLKKMETGGFYALKVDVKLAYDKNSSCGDITKTVTTYFYRKQFEMGTPTVTSTFYTPEKDNNFFNSANNTVQLKIPVLGGGKYLNYDNTKVTAAMKATTVRLYYGPGASDYVDGTLKSAGSGSNYMMADFSLKGVSYETLSGSSGLKLLLQGVTASVGSDYTLWQAQSFDQGKTRTVQLGGKDVSLGLGSYYYELSTHKVDTVGPEVVLQEDGYSGGSGLSGKWQQKVTLVTSVKNNEILYINGGVKRSEGLFSMSFARNGSAVSVVRLSGSTRTAGSSFNVPVNTGRKTDITVATGVELGDVTVTLTGQDFAGNPMTQVYTGLNLDTLAPRVTINTKMLPQDIQGNRNASFEFAIEDASGTGRVNYCFVPEGKTLPSETEGKETSGTIESTLMEWAYIEQNSVAGSTVILKLLPGESFNGTLYYYSVDEAGNKSDMFSQAVSLSNEKAECRVVVADYDHALPEYDVSFIPDAGCVVYYRYATPTSDGGYYRRPYVKYDPNTSKPGSAQAELYLPDGAAGVTGALSGTHILEYKVVNTKSGNTAYFEGGLGIPLTFDNAAPEVSLTQQTKGYSQAAHTFTLSATDVSGIASARYELLTAGDEAVVAEGDLPIADGAVSLSAILGTAELDLGNGAYFLRLYATDANGTEAFAESQAFTIRTEAPEAELEFNGAVPGELELTGMPDYKLTLTVTDSFLGVGEWQNVFWRASADGTNYGPWQTLASLAGENGSLTATASLATPVALEEGLNLVYVQLLCAENAKNLLKETISPASILTLEPLQILMDLSAPAADWQLTCARNNEAITGVLTVSDDLTANPVVSCSDASVTLEADEANANVYNLTYAVPESGSIADAITLTVTDEAGNETELTVTTDLLDLEGPEISFSSPSYETYGDRTDAVVTVTITEPYELGAVDITLDNGDENSLITDNDDGSYTVLLRGFDGSARITVTAADDLGNETTGTSGAISVSYADIEKPTIVSQPAYAQDSATVILSFNVPAVAAMTQEAVEALAEEASRQGGMSLTASCTLQLTEAEFEALKASDAGEGPMTFTIWVQDEFGNVKKFDGIRPTTIFGKEYPVFLTYEQYVDGVLEDAPKALVVGEHVADPDPGVDDDDFTLDARVLVDVPCYYIEYNGELSYLIMRPKEETYDGYEYLNYDNYLWVDKDGNPILDDDGNTIEVPSIAIEDTAGTEPFYCRLMPYTYLSEGDPRIGEGIDEDSVWHGGGDICVKIQPVGPILMESGDYSYYRADPEDYDDKGALLFFLQDSMYEEMSQTLTFEIRNEGGVEENVTSARLNVGLVGYDDSVTDWSATGEAVYVRNTVYSVEDDTEIVVATREEIYTDELWMNRSLTIDCPIITVQPEISWSLTQSNEAPEARLSISASGFGTEIAKLKLLKKNGDGSYTLVAAWIRPDDTETEDAENAGPNLIVNLLKDQTHDDEGEYAVYAENEYGLSTLLEGLTVEIAEKPITEDDFTLSWSIYKDGAWQSVTDDSEEAEEARVIVTVTAAGAARNLTVIDGSDGDKTLTPEEPSYTFEFTDKFGYTYSMPVLYGNLQSPPPPDRTPPTVSYALANTNKTRVPYDVVITVTDDSGVASVTLTSGRVSVDLTRSGDQWTGLIDHSGSYLITALDHEGNRRIAAFTVTNIDTVAPNATVVLSVPENVKTMDQVVASLTFDKPNVTITRMEKTSGSATLDKEKRTVTFQENGAVTVYFRDDYGNTNSAVITVGNIYTDPPHLIAAPALADDELSVAVTFEMEKDEDGVPVDPMRKLSDLTVIYNGVSYSATTTFQLSSNGTYIFTVVDSIGLTQVISLDVTDIDREAPKVTAVSWTYTYLDENGNEKLFTYDLAQITGAGYRIGKDLYPLTTGKVKVNVVTDAPTAYIGSYDGALSTDHELIYHENGMFTYNLQKKNGLSASYAVDVEIIDKTPPAIELENSSFLMFVEFRDTGSVRAMLEDYTAWDEYLGTVTDLTGAVTVDFGGLEPDDLSLNVFDKSKPFTVTYRVKDAAGNETVLLRTVILVGINDVLVTVNGVLPDAGMMAEARTGDVKLELVNFSGVAYCTYASGMRTFGQMKTLGTLIPQANGAFTLAGLADGWYTFFIQTETREYFNIYVYVGE